MPEIVFYTRQGCHLCEVALSLLQEQGLQPRIVDIDAQPSLVAQYDQCVPVVTVDGKVRFRGRVNPVLLRRLLAEPGCSSDRARRRSPPRE